MLYEHKEKTMYDLTQEWIATKKDMVKDSTYAHYQNLLKNHILPALGDYSLGNLGNEIIDDFLKYKLLHGRKDGTGGLSSKTVSDIRSLLVLIFKYAHKRKYIEQLRIDFFSPKKSQKKIQIISKNEQLKLETFLFNNPSPMNLSIILTLYTGIRIGELCALKWEDISLEHRTMSINKTLIRIQNTTDTESKKTKVIVNTPKTECSIRIIPLPSNIISYLIQYKKEKDMYVLTGTEKWIEPRNCLKKYKTVLKKAGISLYSFHTLRHTFATRCVEMGFDIKSLSEILGHSNVNITLQRYVHPTLEQKRTQMEKLEFLK